MFYRDFHCISPCCILYIVSSNLISYVISSAKIQIVACRYFTNCYEFTHFTEFDGPSDIYLKLCEPDGNKYNEMLSECVVKIFSVILVTRFCDITIPLRSSFFQPLTDEDGHVSRSNVLKSATYHSK